MRLHVQPYLTYLTVLNLFVYSFRLSTASCLSSFSHKLQIQRPLQGAPAFKQTQYFFLQPPGQVQWTADGSECYNLTEPRFENKILCSSLVSAFWLIKLDGYSTSSIEILLSNLSISFILWIESPITGIVGMEFMFWWFILQLRSSKWVS